MAVEYGFLSHFLCVCRHFPLSLRLASNCFLNMGEIIPA